MDASISRYLVVNASLVSCSYMVPFNYNLIFTRVDKHGKVGEISSRVHVDHVSLGVEYALLVLCHP